MINPKWEKKIEEDDIYLIIDSPHSKQYHNSKTSQYLKLDLEAIIIGLGDIIEKENTTHPTWQDYEKYKNIINQKFQLSQKEYQIVINYLIKKLDL